MSRRCRWVGIGLVLAGVAALLAWPRPDPWPARWVVSLPSASMPEGFSADGRSFQVTDLSGSATSVPPVWAWDLATGRPVQAPPTAWIGLKALARDGQTCAGVIADASGANQTIVLADTATEAIRLRVPLGGRHANRVALIDADRRIEAVLELRNGTYEVATWEVDSGVETTRVVRGPGTSSTWLLAFAPDGRTWAYLDQMSRGVQFWDSATDQPIGPLHPSPTAPSVAVGWPWTRSLFTPDGRTLLAGRSDGQVEFWDVARQCWLKTLRLHPPDHTIYSLMIAPDGRLLASTGIGRPSPTRFGQLRETAQIWLTGQGSYGSVQELAITDLATDQPLVRLPGASFRAFHPDGRTVITCELGGTLSNRPTPAGPKPALSARDRPQTPPEPPR